VLARGHDSGQVGGQFALPPDGVMAGAQLLDLGLGGEPDRSGK
jgi:hypothetical protein